MNEERQENTIQITEVLDLFVRSLRRVWWVCLLLIALCSALFGGYARVSYRPQYTASMTFLVNTGSGRTRGALWYSVGRYVYVPIAVVLCFVALFKHISF